MGTHWEQKPQKILSPLPPKEKNGPLGCIYVGSPHELPKKLLCQPLFFIIFGLGFGT
jgi:hypothetical protein